MNPVAAALIASLSCQNPDAVRREMNAAADFLDYRVARMEKCR